MEKVTAKHHREEFSSKAAGRPSTSTNPGRLTCLTFPSINTGYWKEAESYQNMWDVQPSSRCEWEKNQKGITIYVWRL
ncbi:hypothetical protein NPIL_674661 [Nephila pilipes]|uniref:Uncharacterized protein n=1 Tax=Nephila pilipes TaxID=299642 RepID=A0A8X6N739_NEPPI|nr:hypothetical protein NPIL_674661 [Nephila pilipes]